jgi:hypothetical protein
MDDLCLSHIASPIVVVAVLNLSKDLPVATITWTLVNLLYGVPVSKTFKSMCWDHLGYHALPRASWMTEEIVSRVHWFVGYRWLQNILDGYVNHPTKLIMTTDSRNLKVRFTASLDSNPTFIFYEFHRHLTSIAIMNSSGSVTCTLPLKPIRNELVSPK